VKKILIVDDEPDILEWLSIFLKRNGYEVWTANNGKEAFEQVVKMPDLIMDVRMPGGLDGIDVYQHLKADDNYSQIPVILSSAMNQENLISLSYKAGVNNFLPRPFDSKELIKLVYKYLGHSKDQMTSTQHFLALVAFVKISINRTKILFALYEADKFPSELARDLGMDISIVSKILKALNEKEIVFCHNPHQKKGKLFSLSNQGRKIFQFLNNLELSS
jgi:CheY-like chemotaxis protein